MRMQAHILTWQHLSQQQLAALKAAPKAPGEPTPRELLMQHPCVAGHDPSRTAILLDLFASTLEQAQVRVPSMLAAPGLRPARRR